MMLTSSLVGAGGDEPLAVVRGAQPPDLLPGGVGLDGLGHLGRRHVHHQDLAGLGPDYGLAVRLMFYVQLEPDL